MRIIGKLGKMRKEVGWVVYPIKSSRIIVQSDSRIAEFDPQTGNGRLSKNHSGGAYFHHLIFAEPIHVPQEFVDMCQNILKKIDKNDTIFTIL